MRIDNRIKICAIILIVFLCLVGSFFVVRFPPSPQLWPVSVIAICLFFLPILIGTVQWIGLTRAIIVLVSFGLYALLFESMAIISGIPYGHFHYSDVLGPKIAGLVPWVVFLAWSPLVLGIIGQFKFSSYGKAFLMATLVIVLADGVLDPAAVGLGFWSWNDRGIYYGVPLVNYVGWLISAGGAVAVIEHIRRRDGWPAPPRFLLYAFAATVCFWGFVNVFLNQWIPAVLAIGLVMALGLSLRRQAVRVIH